MMTNEQMKEVEFSEKCPYCLLSFYNKHALLTHIGIVHSNKPKKTKMKNITINIPEIYDKNIQKLITMNFLSSRSEAIRTAVREYLNKEYNKNLELLGFFEIDKNKKLID